ncbi:type II toxin-antitoxin system VapB family antitoxin [Occultella kanbiaonis]|uniref:type II toxin-antitoxin system VapB family antitoxin n=1 Tax=Occultella kanbiaonis TaxID=2675754 RepID=UPI0012B7EED1|nr:type II toxin-antitoxin system VapB family antitoxin [Occultella kanbiaonis]
MSLNIKNERVHALAREAAERTGRTQTGAIEFALERLLATLPERDERGGARIDRLLDDLRGRLGDDTLTTDDLYDETGLYR